MDAADFCLLFSGVSVCRCTPGWQHASEEVIATPGELSLLTLVVDGTVPIRCDVTVHQADRRSHLGKPGFDAAGFAYLGVRVYIVNAATLHIAASCQLVSQRDVYVEAALPPGTYWILVETDWDGTPRPDSTSDGVELGVSCRSDASRPEAATLLRPAHLPAQAAAARRILHAALAARCEASADVLVAEALFATERPEVRLLQGNLVDRRFASLEGGHVSAWLYRNASRRLVFIDQLPLTLSNVRVELILPNVSARVEGVAEVRVEPGETALLVLSQRAAGAFAWSLPDGGAEGGGAQATLTEL
jgi:hypothetical protein